MSNLGAQVSRERLLQLLDQGEGVDLDFKATCDLNERAEMVAIAKDIAAFCAAGGHLVVGVNEDGTPSGRFDPTQAKLFDEATLRAKIAPTYLPESISLAGAVHEVDGLPVAVVYIAPSPNGFVVMQRDGDYTAANGHQKQEFRAGHVYVRRGSSSRLWSQDEADAALERALSVRREGWRAELRDDLAALGLGQQAQGIARGPAASFTWQLDNDAFTATLVELIRAQDVVTLILSIDAMRHDGVAALVAGPADDLRTILDRLVATAAVALTVSRHDLLERVLEVLVDLYNRAFDARGYVRADLAGPRAAELWLEVITRVYALGALAVRRRDWEGAKKLALQKGSGQDFDYSPNWLRHALTNAARAGHLQAERDGGRVELSLLLLAAEHVERIAALRSDVPAGDEAVLTSLTQFDLLSILAAISDAGTLDDRAWYTNFARFDWHRSEPALTALLGDPAMRSVLFPRSDTDLAAAIREVSRMAASEGLRYAVWTHWESPSIERFLAAHPGAEIG